MANDTVTVYIKGKDEVLSLKQAPTSQTDEINNQPRAKSNNQHITGVAKSAKVTLVIDPASITEMDSVGKKQVKIIVTVGPMKFEAMLNSKSYRKALTSIEEYGADHCNAILQATMVKQGVLESAGLIIQPKPVKQPATEKVEENNV
jgi:hypothetical protein